MPQFRITQDHSGYKAGEVVEVKPGNVGIWAARPWAKRIPTPVETATCGPRENAALRTSKVEVQERGGGWYAVLKDGNEVGKRRGREDADALAASLGGG
jgi:hypothetical protein